MPPGWANKINRANSAPPDRSYRKGNFFLHISITIPAPRLNNHGAVSRRPRLQPLAVTSDNKFRAAKNIRHEEPATKGRDDLSRPTAARAPNGRSSVSLVVRGVLSRTPITASANKSWLTAKANNQRIVLEDLNGIRETGKAKCVHEWSFAQLQWMIRYKAACAGVEVVLYQPSVHVSDLF